MVTEKLPADRYWRLGIDIGQSADPTAMIACELDGDNFLFRKVSRIALGTPYPQVMETIRTAAVNIRKHGNLVIYVDGTGVGAPIVDMLRTTVREIASIRSVEICAGNERREVVKTGGRPVIRCGKAYMVARLKTLMQQQHILGNAKSSEFTALQAELRAFQMKIRPNSTGYEAQSGAHDDLVIAAALAVLDPIEGDSKHAVDANRAMAIRNEFADEMALGGDFGRNIMGMSW